MSRRLFALAFVFVFAFAPMAAVATIMRDGDYEMRGTYAGVLYCSDCPGIWTEVTLEDDGPNIGEGRGTFVTTERYSGGAHGAQTIVTTGTWSAISRDAWGTSGILALQSGVKGSLPRYFACDGGRRLREVTATGSPLDVPQLDQSMLTRVIPPPIPWFASLTEKDNNRTVYGRVGDRFSVNLLPKPAPGATPNPRPDFSVFSLVDVTQVPSVPFALDVYGKDAFVDIVAANPGRARLTFRSRSKPVRVFTFDFEIRP